MIIICLHHNLLLFLVMEQKKELLTKVLEKLKWYRNMSEDLLFLVNSSCCTEELMDSIITKVNITIKSVKKQTDKKALRKWLTAVQKIMQREEEEKLSIWELDSEFDKILNSI